MKRRLPNWMVEDNPQQSNRCSIQPLFSTDDTAFVRSFSPPPADSPVPEIPHNRQLIRILRPSQINNIVAMVPSIEANRSGTDLDILTNVHDENESNHGEDIKIEDEELTLLESLEANSHGTNTSDLNRATDQLEINSVISGAGPSCLPVVVSHRLEDPEIKAEPTVEPMVEGTPTKVKVEPQASTPITPIQTAATSIPITPVRTAATSSNRTASRVSCNYGVKCFRRNPQHRNDTAHPGDPDYRRPVFPEPPPGTPACPFGASCYRRNPQHFLQLHHPPASLYDPNTVPASYGVTPPQQRTVLGPPSPQQYGKGKRKKTPMFTNSNADDENEDDDDEEDPFAADDGSTDEFDPDEEE